MTRGLPPIRPTDADRATAAQFVDEGILAGQFRAGSRDRLVRYAATLAMIARQEAGRSPAVAGSRAQASHEEWRAVTGYEGLYEVSSLGRARSLPRTVQTPKGPRRLKGCILKPAPTKDGYLQIGLRRDGRLKMARLNRLVCRAFNGEPNALHREAAHRDGDKLNNRADNLKWASPAENTFHKRAHGTHQAGERHPRAKLTEAAVRHIRSVHGQREALAEQYAVSVHAIDDVRRGRNWKHVRPTNARKDAA